MKLLIRKLSICTFVSVVIFVSSYTQVLAEDVEIYNRLQTEPNVLFILDQSESMLQMVGSTGLTRDQVVKQAFQTVMSQPYQNLNVGFMDYGRDNGAGVDLPVADVNDFAKNVEPDVVSTTETYASLLTRFSNNLEGPQPNAKTALVEALLEAAKYYRGDIIDNLSQGIGNQGTWDDSQSRYTGGHWRAAGPRTLTVGASTPVQGSYCHHSSSPAGAPYSQCSNPFPGTCQNRPADPPSTWPPVTHQHGSSCTNPPGYGCTQYDITGTECVTYGCLGGTTPNPTHTHPGGSDPGHPAYVRCRETDYTTAKKYISPIQSACTENFIVLLSDGAPTILGSHEQTSIQGFAGTSSCDDLSTTYGFTDPSILSKGRCGPDLTKAISTLDIAPWVSGTQTVNTYTIGFDLGAGANEAKQYLQTLATEGNGQYFDATGSGGTTGLVTIFQNIFNAITNKSRTIARVGNTLDLGTLGSSLDDVYVPMFTAMPNKPRWPGNLKGFTLDPSGVLVGLDGNPIFQASGDFSPLTRSYWSTSADGGSAKLGGAAQHIDPTTRNAMTDDGAGTSRSLVSLDAANTSLTGNPALFGLPGGTPTTDIQDLINWARGVDIDDEDLNPSTTNRKAMGDALHTDPIIAQYDPNDDGVIDQKVAFFMTNEGYLHAIDVTGNTSGTGGNELFSYMPSDLLDNLDTLRKNVVGPKVYGLDGPLVMYQAGGLANANGAKYLFFGMRRGGMNYYALDISNPTSPSLMWVIEGGSGDYKELAQSWSEPIVTKVLHGGSAKLALIMGGGYDTTQDTATSYTADTRGRAIYVVDAMTGAKLWSAGPNTLTPNSPDTHDLDLSLANGIAADVSVIDFDSDLVADRLYFADTGGSIWRIDFQGDLTGTVGSVEIFLDMNLRIYTVLLQTIIESFLQDQLLR